MVFSARRITLLSCDLTQYTYMSFAIQLDQDQSLINTKLMGEITPEIALEFFQELLQKTQASGISKIFSDATELKLTRPIEEFQELPGKLLQLGFPKDMKRAILVANEPDYFKIWENMLFNTGFHSVKLFWNEEKAREWLMSQTT